MKITLRFYWIFFLLLLFSKEVVVECRISVAGVCNCSLFVSSTVRLVLEKQATILIMWDCLG